MFFTEAALQRCSFSKFTGEYPCRSTISIKFKSNFVEITLRHGYSVLNLLHIFKTSFIKNTRARLLQFVQLPTHLGCR